MTAAQVRERKTADALLSIIAGRDTTGLIEVRWPVPNGMGQRWFDVRNRQACIDFMANKSHETDVFIGVALRTARKGGKAAIRHSWLLYVDCDSSDAAARVRAFTPRPSLIVRSGTGENCHAYWALTEPLSPAWFERGNRRLAHHLGTDVKVTDAARILRPPGTLNHKHNPPTCVEVEHVDTGSRPVDVFHLLKNLPDLSPNPPRRQHRPDTARSADPLLNVSSDRYYAVLTGREVTYGNVTCPFHDEGRERNPSMRLYPGGTFYCFGCQVGGSIFEFGSHLWNMGKRGEDFKRLRDRLTDALR